MKMRITKHDVNTAREPSLWDFGNKILYDLCKNFPKHNKEQQIVAKVLLIGRSYSAALERRRNAKEVENVYDFYKSVVAPKMLRAGIDRWFVALRADNSPGSSASVKIHKQLLDLFFDMTELEKRSLASKYLHFHFPYAFFMYDSRTARAIAKVVPRSKGKFGITETNLNVDRVYNDFVKRCVSLREYIHEEQQIWLTPRELDRLLLAITDNKMKEVLHKPKSKKSRSRFIGDASDLIITKKSDADRMYETDDALSKPSRSDIKPLLKNARRQARKAGMKKSDIAAAIRKVRKRS